MPEQSLDSRGRVTIEPQLRPFLGKRFVQVLMPDGIHLVPLTGRLEWDSAPPDLAINASRIAEEQGLRDYEEKMARIHGVNHEGKRGRKPAHRVRKTKRRPA